MISLLREPRSRVQDHLMLINYRIWKNYKKIVILAAILCRSRLMILITRLMGGRTILRMRKIRLLLRLPLLRLLSSKCPLLMPRLPILKSSYKMLRIKRINYSKTNLNTNKQSTPQTAKFAISNAKSTISNAKSTISSQKALP